MKRNHVVIFLTIFFIGSQLILAVTPKKWELRTLKDFIHGEFKGVSISAEGQLRLAPQEDFLEGPDEEFYLSLLIARDGSLFLGTGHSGKLYRRDPSGKIELYYQVPEMDIYCLAQDERGNIYLGSSPNGKIYKITAKEKGEEFFNPQEKYIWDLEFTSDGTLLAAVGESGGIYAISPRGEGRQIFEAQENHILCLELTSSNKIFAGSGGGGSVYSLDIQGKAELIYESSYEEIKSLVVDRQGNIFAAASGVLVKSKNKVAFPSLPTTSSQNIEITVSPSSVSSSSPKKSTSPSLTKHPSALYRIAPSGLAERLWSSEEELIYSIYLDEANGSIIFGTGNKGRLYSVDFNKNLTLLFQKDSEQIYLLVPGKGKIFLLANNPARLSLVHPELRSSGEYLSQVFDTRILSSWGRLRWEAKIPEGNTLQLQTRSGNSFEVNSTWSDWSPPYRRGPAEQVLSPPGRFIQFKVLFQSPSGRLSPEVSLISLVYLQANIAPLLTSLQLLPPNVVLEKPLDSERPIWGLEEKDLDHKKKDRDKQLKSTLLAKKVTKKGYRTIVWQASDENEDSLVYSIFIKEAGESKWRLIRRDWPEEVFVLETNTFPDGVYALKLVASDWPSNPVGQEKQAEKELYPLVIDNSLPVIKNFQPVIKGKKLSLSFNVEDAFSAIKEVKILLRPEDWRLLVPVDGICDSQRESFKVQVTIPLDSDGLLTIKVVDEHDNVGVYRHAFN
ncbi:MAG: hypothetical protein B5M54_00215 [Candidatus Aminicenantes bacterium 4484_214]|nr:MAG: hypothetical protein B5M54_00215 [Candidatus Aminicenantes bacterium 4484_214]